MRQRSHTELSNIIKESRAEMERFDALMARAEELCKPPKFAPPVKHKSRIDWQMFSLCLVLAAIGAMSIR